MGFAQAPHRAGLEICNVGSLSKTLAHALTRRYLDAYYQMDPTLEADDATDLPRLARMNPAVPASSVYKEYFFSRGRMADRIAVTTRWQHTRLACYLYRTSRSQPFSEHDIEALHRAMHVVAALFRQHYVLTVASGKLAPGVSLNARVERLASLSPREHDVFKRLISGLSTEAIALDLNISANTVRTFRKKLYRKLQVTSRFDLINQYVYHLKH